ncbi:MAG: high-affinity branched-chain amino acid ABC transporter permease LivM [Alphaproteobacteria bacterium]
MFKEAGMTALVVFALAIGLVGFELRDVPGALALHTHFADVAAAVGIAFVGRIGLILVRHGYGLPVLIVAGLVSLVMVAILLASGLIAGEPAWVKKLLPFNSPVMHWALALVALILAGRGAVVWRRGPVAPAAKPATNGRWAAAVDKYAGLVLVLVAVTFPFWPWTSTRDLDVAILVVTYIMLGWGLNIVVGLAGLLDLGYVAFYAVGAYSYALLATSLGLGFWVCLPLAGLFAAMAGVLLGFPVLRLRGDYLAIVTLGFGEMIRVTLLNWTELTNGPNGISSIPWPTLFGLNFSTIPPEGETAFHEYFGLEESQNYALMFLFYLIAAMALVTNWFTLRIRKLPIGRAWEALREDEIACRSLGINPTNTKMTAFAIGAMFGGFAGAFFATKQTFISPESFTFIESAVILAIVVLGGFGSQMGVVLAAALLIGLPELFRDLALFRMLAFGAAMVLIMLWKPGGLVGRREPTIRLHAKGRG